MDPPVMQLMREALAQCKQVYAQLTAQDVDDTLNALPSTPDALAVPSSAHDTPAVSTAPAQPSFARENYADYVIHLDSEEDELPETVEMKKADAVIEKKMKKMAAREERRLREAARLMKVEEERREREREERERRERKQREQEEARLKEMRLEQAERQERETIKELVEQKNQVTWMKIDREAKRTEELKKEAEKEKLISELRKKIATEEKGLELMRKGRESRDQKLEAEKAKEKQLEELCEVKKAERIKATKEVDDLPHSKSLRYSRECKICANDNPRKRAVMILCGHVTCGTCADTFPKTPSGTIACPYCRKNTNYVRIFEDLDETPEERQDTPEVRKRKADGSDEASSSKIVHVTNTSDAPISID